MRASTCTVETDKSRMSRSRGWWRRKSGAIREERTKVVVAFAEAPSPSAPVAGNSSAHNRSMVVEEAPVSPGQAREPGGTMSSVSGPPPPSPSQPCPARVSPHSHHCCVRLLAVVAFYIFISSRLAFRYPILGCSVEDPVEDGITPVV